MNEKTKIKDAATLRQTQPIAQPTKTPKPAQQGKPDRLQAFMGEARTRFDAERSRKKATTPVNSPGMGHDL